MLHAMRTAGSILPAVLFYLLLAASPLLAGNNYIVGPGDVLNISVYNNDDMTTTVQVSLDRTIVMPLLGRVTVKDLTVSQVGENLTRLLADGYLVNPQVNVFIKEFRSKKVFVLGQVRQPGLIELSGPITLLELLSRVGGIEQDAGDTATIKRTLEGKDQIISVNLHNLRTGKDFSQNYAIQDGDTVMVSKSAMCYITGEVSQPGSYPCGKKSTVLQMIALANGFNGKAARGSVRIVREVDGQKKIYKDVDLNSTTVEDNDVIVVPESFF
nr:polysaccharide biosynthesis/export family protein [Desulforhopalus vacuolatus]